MTDKALDLHLAQAVLDHLRKSLPKAKAEALVANAAWIRQQEIREKLKAKHQGRIKFPLLNEVDKAQALATRKLNAILSAIKTAEEEVEKLTKTMSMEFS